MRRSLVIAISLLAVSVLFVAGPSLLFSPSTSEIAPDETEVDPRMTSLEESESEFWRYLSPQERFQQRSPINVVVRGDTEEIVRKLSEADDGEWEEMEPPEEAEENETLLEEEGGHATGIEWGDAATGIEWGDAEGATRYAWIDPGPDEDGFWTDETAQVEDGDYYGERYHIRLYETPNPDDRWVVMQAHSEHFDWFTLRHRVDGVEAAQTKVESDFVSHPQVDMEEDVRRVYLDNDGPSDANGWATIVDLAGMVVLPAGVGLAAGRRASTGTEIDPERVSETAPEAIDDRLTDVDRRRIAAAYDRVEAGHLILVFAILALFLGVRVAGLALERHVTFMSAHMIAATLYPVIAVGIPVATYLIAGTLTRRLDAAIVAAGSLALAIWIDYGMVGVGSLPVDVVVQRMFVVVSLGLIAGGAARRATRDGRFNDMLVVGAVMWLLVLTSTLLGYF